MMSSAKKICKTLKDVFDRPNFYQELLQESNNEMNLFYLNMGRIIEYYIRTRDKKTNYTISEYLYKKIPALDKKRRNLGRQRKNTLANGFLTFSCSGVYYDYIKNYGVSRNEFFKDELEDNIKYLEDNMGIYDVFSLKSKDCIYLSSPGSMRIYYASNQVPERLFTGILKQEKGNALPVIVGEDKVTYYKKVLNRNLNLIAKENKDELISKGNMVIEEIFECNPYMVFVPIFGKNYDLKVTLKNNSVNIIDYINESMHYDVDNLSFFFSHQADGGWGPNKLNDLIIKNTVIPESELGFLEVLQRYDFWQLKAENLKLEDGCMLDYFTGDVIYQDLINDEENSDDCVINF